MIREYHYLKLHGTASGSSLPNKTIAKQEWTQSNAQQNTEHQQNHTTGATHFSLFVATSVKNRGSYMSAHVLLNLLNELGKRDKMRGLPSILSLFSQRV